MNNFKVICPSGSINYVSEKDRNFAANRFNNNGATVSFGKFINNIEFGGRAKITERLDDYYSGLFDDNITHLIAGAGGFHILEILSHLDWGVLKNNYKPICGHSDITTLQNAIFRRINQISFYSPNFSAFGMQQGFDYSEANFFKAINNNTIKYIASSSWSDDEWYLDQDNRNILPNVGPQIIKEGSAEGLLLGGNISSMALLQGSEYLPDLRGNILLAEEDAVSGDTTIDIFLRQLRSLIHAAGMPSALLIGRFQKNSDVNLDVLSGCIAREFDDINIPIVSNLDFGHTSPMFTFVIGSEAQIIASDNKFELVTKNSTSFT